MNSTAFSKWKPHSDESINTDASAYRAGDNDLQDAFQEQHFQALLDILILRQLGTHGLCKGWKKRAKLIAGTDTYGDGYGDSELPNIDAAIKEIADRYELLKRASFTISKLQGIVNADHIDEQH